jgi:hypothetical protein
MLLNTFAFSLISVAAAKYLSLRVPGLSLTPKSLREKNLKK